ncbi:MAG: argininosuccinate synthase [Bacteroidales bacterium]|nr:argininosuccinate synthase [Bacteroidales bacterium]
MKKKVLLAFSGGLDTSYCAKYLSEVEKYDVHSAIVNTGGFSAEDLATIEQTAYKLGVSSHTVLDITQDYYQKCIRYMVYGNVLRNNTYPLSVSSERTFQALALVEYAIKIGVDAIAHGSTGAGNDQIRFESAFIILAPDIEVIAPIREMKLSRQQEIDFLKEHGIDGDWKKAEYSINQGIWGTSIGGKETLSSNTGLPEAAYLKQLKKQTPEKIELQFEKGEITGVNGQLIANKVQLINKIEELASAFAIGRDIHLGDTIIGIKGRVGFEAAAALLIIKAHHALEKHVLTKWQLHHKDYLANIYGMMLHESQYFEPVMRDIEAFLENNQKNVTGKVFIKLMPYHFQIEGIESEFDLMNSEFGNYGEENKSWTAQDVIGFTNIMSNQMKIYHQINK